MMNVATKIRPYSADEGKMSVLVVDDHRYFRESLVSYLSDVLAVSIAGSAANGVEAVALVEKLRPLLVIMDIQMPEMDGVTACGILKASHPDLRVILYSMHTFDTFDKETLGRADSFVPKDRLFEELSGLLGMGVSCCDFRCVGILPAFRAGSCSNKACVFKDYSSDTPA